MKRNDFLLNVFAAAAFLALGFVVGYAYQTRECLGRSLEVMHRDGTEYQPEDLTYIATGELNK